MSDSPNPITQVDICDVGARDGLQSEKRIWSVAERVQLINRLDLNLDGEIDLLLKAVRTLAGGDASSRKYL